jgi:hypothetical protein
MRKSAKQNLGLEGTRLSNPRHRKTPSNHLGAPEPFLFAWPSERSLLKPPPWDATPTAVKLLSLSFNTLRKTEVVAELFEPAAFTAVRKTVANGGGSWIAPAGECRARITRCGGSSLVSVEQSSCRKPLGMAVVSWSELLAPFVWGELLRANEDGGRRFDVGKFMLEFPGFTTLPRMGTLVWPAIETCLDSEALLLVEATFWSLGLALVMEHVRTQRLGCQGL